MWVEVHTCTRSRKVACHRKPQQALSSVHTILRHSSKWISVIHWAPTISWWGQRTPISSTPSSQWSPSYQDSISRTKSWKWNVKMMSLASLLQLEFNRVAMHESVSDGQYHTCTSYYSVDRALPILDSLSPNARPINLASSLQTGEQTYQSLHSFELMWSFLNPLRNQFLLLIPVSEAPSYRLGLRKS